MKLISSLFFFLAISTKLFSQTSTPANKIIYLDSTWTEATTENYKYIRLVEEYYAANKKTYIFKDYYKSKTLQMVGSSTDRDILKREGQFVYYYENGNKKLTVNYSNNKKTGKEFNWYENGTLKAELEYLSHNNEDGLNFKVNNYWTEQKEQKVVSGNGDLEYKDEYIEESGKIKNGFPDGTWKGKDHKLKYTFTENYENGKLVSGVSKDSLNVEYTYTIVNQRPNPKKGINSFYNYVGKSINIPIEARNKVYGKIYLTFIVDKDGSLVEPKILKGVGYGLDEEAIRVINNSKKWIPGMIRGIPARVLYSLPITIAKNGR